MSNGLRFPKRYLRARKSPRDDFVSLRCRTGFVLDGEGVTLKVVVVDQHVALGKGTSQKKALLEAVVAPSPAFISTLPSKWPGALGQCNMQAVCPQLYGPVGIDAGTLARSPRFWH